MIERVYKPTISVFGTAEIGSIIDILGMANPVATVVFDFCGVGPRGLASYRGYYDHLALGWSDEFDGDWPSVDTISAILEDAISRRFTGYKGGEYTMRRDTPLWVDKWGDASGTGIVGIEFLGGNSVVLQTAKVD